MGNLRELSRRSSRWGKGIGWLLADLVGTQWTARTQRAMEAFDSGGKRR
jgi:hypothetical protein